MNTISKDIVRVYFMIFIGILISLWVLINEDIIVGIKYLSIGIVAFLGYKYLHPTVKTMIGIDKNIGYDIALGSMAGLVFVALIAFASLSMVLPYILFEIFGITSVQHDIILGLIIVTVVATTLEEPLFRGIILGVARRSWGNVIGILVTALIFAAFHATVYGASSAGDFIGCALFSIIASILVIRSNSLLPAVCMHAVANAYLFLAVVW